MYPESAPKDWREQLRLTGLQVAISPLHDKDTNPTGEPKKAHHHVILVYGSPTTYSNVKALTNGKLGQTIPQAIEQVRGMYNYLTHADNPEKHQYDPKDIQTLNGFSIRDFCEMTKSEVARYKREVQAFIRDNGITEYGYLMDLLMDADGMENHWEVAGNNTLFFTAYLTSRRYIAAGRSAEQQPDDSQVLGKTGQSGGGTRRTEEAPSAEPSGADGESGPPRSGKPGRSK
ncbi:MAG: replication protein [Oscillospiraceae bacterium]|nr:replication protein [Oscillospiraceae bacterium]